MNKLKALFSKIDKSVLLYVQFSIFDTLVGLVGMLVYGILTVTGGPIWIRNQFVGLWLLVLVTIYGILSLYLQTKNMERVRGKVFYIDLAFFVLTTLVCLLLSIFFGIAGKIDATIWAVYIMAVNLTNCWLVFLRTKKVEEASVPEVSDRLLGLDENVCGFKKSNYKIVSGFNIGLRLLSLVLLGFLLAGSITVGAGTLKYPPRGKFMNIREDNGSDREYSVHYLCDGPINSSLPVFLIEGGASHSLADFLLIQNSLKDENRRSCIWDKPGLGYSDYLYTGTRDYLNVYHNFITRLDENPPYALIGLGKGGQLIYEYASKHSEMVKSLTFIDVMPNNMEFEIRKTLKNWSPDEMNEYKASVISSRKRYLNNMNGLAVPFGLTNSIIPEQLGQEEARWHQLTEKIWRTEKYFLPILSEASDIFKQVTINQSIPIDVIISYKTDEQIRKEKCLLISDNSAECLYEIEYNKKSIIERSELVNLSSSGQLIKCDFHNCNYEYFMSSVGSSFTAEKLVMLN